MERVGHRIVQRAVAAAPDNAMVVAPAEAVLQVRVPGVGGVVGDGRAVVEGAIEIGVGREAAAVPEVAAPVTAQMTAGGAGIQHHGLRRDEGGRGHGRGHADIGAAEHFQRDRHGIPVGRVVVDAQSQATLAQGAAGQAAVADARGVLAIEADAVDPQPRARVEGHAVARREALLVGADHGRQQRPLRGGHALGDDVHHAVHRVRAPDAGTGAADHLDAVDVLEHRVLRIPEAAGEDRRIDAAAVHQHQQLVGEAAVGAAGRDGPFGAVDARHLQAGHETQRVDDAGGAAAADVLAREHRHGGGRVRQPLRPLRHRRHLDLDAHQVLQPQFRQPAGQRRRGGRRQTTQAQRQQECGRPRRTCKAPPEAAKDGHDGFGYRLAAFRPVTVKRVPT